jgi:hypothetical protein
VCSDNIGECGQRDEWRECAVTPEISSEAKACVCFQCAKRTRRVARLRGQNRLHPHIRRLDRPRLGCVRNFVSRSSDVVGIYCFCCAPPRGARYSRGVNRGKPGHLLAGGRRGRDGTERGTEERDSA